MNISKLEGLVDAIEAESHQPSPSHQNLARLIAMFFRELISSYVQIPINAYETNAQVTTTMAQGESNVESTEIKPRRKLKNSKE